MSDTSYFRQSKRELRIILGTWAAFCLWVVGYCSAQGYDIDPDKFTTTFGMPSWVFWGIAMPWLAATASTVVFGFILLKDQPLEPAEGEGG